MGVLYQSRRSQAKANEDCESGRYIQSDFVIPVVPLSDLIMETQFHE